MSELYDTYAKHIIDTEFYAQGKEADIEERLKALKRRLRGIITEKEQILSQVQYIETIDECDEEIEDEIEDFYKEAQEEQKKQVQLENSWLKDFMQKFFNVAITALAVKTIWDILFKKFNNTDNFEIFKNKLKDDIKSSVRSSMGSSLMLGTSTTDAATTVENKMNRLLIEAKSNIHTSVTSIQRNTQNLSLSNSGVTLKFISMLDEKTCLHCGSLSGNLYVAGSEPQLPLHNRCRCYLLPVNEDEETLDYRTWLSQQSDSTVYKILGKSRYLLYKSGTPITKFTSDGHKLTLKELYDKK